MESLPRPQCSPALQRTTGVTAYHRGGGGGCVSLDEEDEKKQALAHPLPPVIIIEEAPPFKPIKRTQTRARRAAAKKRSAVGREKERERTPFRPKKATDAMTAGGGEGKEEEGGGEGFPLFRAYTLPPPPTAIVSNPTREICVRSSSLAMATERPPPPSLATARDGEQEKENDCLACPALAVPRV
ncbi:hypothetical protein LX36DRAFT_196966 [Colletotrichum falcatum]|nr:hypothetical protein LX36DRAFT_196966 [Colletotrichum falcatum]